jgi:two-component system, cell cycle response regulator CtrA
MRILLIEDDTVTAHSIHLALKLENISVDWAALGKDGLELGTPNYYDVILLDLNLPDISGFEVLTSLRMCGVKTPVLILSGGSGLHEKVTCLRGGADDYITKPFHNNELVARIHAIVRRSKGLVQSIIKTGGLCVDLDAKMVKVNGTPLHLTRKEYQILELLSLRKGSTLSKSMFLNNLYSGLDEPNGKIIDVFLSKLRKKISRAAKGQYYIETVRGHGYVLREPAAEPANLSA